MTAAAVAASSETGQLDPVSIAGRRALLYAAAIGIAFTILCLLLAYQLNIWQDEAYSLHTTSDGIAQAWRQGIGFEAQAPLYFVVLAAWRTLSASVFNARLLSIACSLVTLYATWHFARRYIANISPVVVLAAVAFNPFTIWAALEIRPYAAAIMFSALLLYAFFRGFVDERPSATARVACAVLTVLGSYTQYYIALMLPAQFVALLALRRWRTLPTFTAVTIAVGIAMVPLAFIVPQQFSAYHAFTVAFRIPSYIMATALFEYALPRNWISSWTHQSLRNGLYLIAAAIPLALVVCYVRRLDVTARALLAIVGMLLLLFTAAIVVAHVNLIVGRHTAVMFVPTLLLAFTMIGAIIARRRNVALVSYAILYAVFCMLSLWHQYHTLSKDGDWKRVAAFLGAHAGRTDVIAVFNAEAELPLRYYFHSNTPIAAIPRSMSFERFDEDSFIFRDDRDAAAVVGTHSGRARRVWLVESSVCSTRIDFFGCKRLNRYVEKRFRTLDTIRFNGTTVSELQPLTAGDVAAGNLRTK